MNTAQLQAWVQQNKTAVLGVAGAGVVALALRAKRKSSTAGGETPPASALGTAFATGANIAGTVPYNSAASDAYNALMPAIERLYSMQEQQQASPMPVPLAAGLDAPTFTGKYVSYGDGGVYEVQNDGSLFHLSLGQFGDVQRRFGIAETNPMSFAGSAPSNYSTTSNLQALIAKGNPAK